MQGLAKLSIFSAQWQILMRPGYCDRSQKFYLRMEEKDACESLSRSFMSLASEMRPSMD